MQLAAPSKNQFFSDEVAAQTDFDVENINDICYQTSLSQPQLSFSVEEVKAAVKELNTGKAQDGANLQVEHFLYGGEDAYKITAQLLNAIATHRKIPLCMKQGILSPIYNRKGDKKNSVNYRGITIMPVLYKILEVLLRKHLKEITDPIQSRLQRGFTANASPLHCTLLVQEALLAAKARKQDLFIAFLDTKSAFDVVPHNSLNRKLFNSGVNGALWLLLRDLHQEATSCIKWDGVTSDPFSVLQGVRQGGVLSTELYKIFINDLLERLNNSGLGTTVGHLRIPAPTYADDVALIAESKEELAILINMAVDYSNREHYVLQPTKGVVMQVASSNRRELVPHHNFEINGAAMPIVEQTSHMGILRASRNQN
ncbi:uncharacterized protein LOC117325588 [Pecten maximus]|uniref:uncharacterized protein LOC117325588 n=1 Tax=Pecten maximus TaxID=6579 RepID=UPI00145822A7|nr:uncharacterized protein LOC117325588 [Pecten maximus]